jgi:hypothetical protein
MAVFVRLFHPYIIFILKILHLTKWAVINLQTLMEKHVITFWKQLINLLYQPTWTILMNLGEINNIKSIIFLFYSYIRLSSLQYLQLIFMYIVIVYVCFICMYLICLNKILLNMTPLIILSKLKFYYRVKFLLYQLHVQEYDK